MAAGILGGAGGAVAGGHDETVRAAATILAEGGNAFDAACAGVAAACVCEPVLASLGGGGFLLAEPAGGEARIYDFFVDTPARRPDLGALDFEAIEADFGTARQVFHIGLGATAVPGLPAGLEAVARELGRLPLALSLAPAVGLAREGYLLRPVDAFVASVVAPIVTACPALRSLHCRPDGGLRASGERMVQPDLAASLEQLGREGAAPFYRGERAGQLAALCRETGGLLAAEDLAGYRVRRRRPLATRFGGAGILTNAPPSSGGLLIAFALDLLAGEALGGFGSARHLSLLGRAMALTSRARLESGLATAEDADSETAAAARLFDPDLVARYRAELAGRPGVSRGTTHLSVVDRRGNAAAATLSNGEGCGRVLPGSGIHLNNMLGEADLNPLGFHAWPTGVRLGSMMAPTLARTADGGLLALGSGGSNRLRTAILQVLVNCLGHGLDPAAAVTAPRLHVENGTVQVEPGFKAAALAGLAEFGAPTRWPEPNLFFGGVHLVRRAADGVLAAVGDPRRGGAAQVI
ncbi:gamma-glutamyltranspeptidase / glutathione hydrolase [Tistlia consotensis]|uniref:Gamma-glutamyltransferase. Threonine peptidase. MEROPS family T03 n=1 Tax=Tistlia consotensis USBA 355 TaxID=560819 RepID=A0A1Y6B4J1_9PROT|nr:gamma-glutamyltransferase [Tistlia consotensis]SME89716.1 gamma-glutamyltransferase. Threonine peptidase. MEROPS family T03 [Tistlia consotensis USBA 355]SNR26232.1 gamma-glutamyltranspeptidase / glutathione hydrolase [Tistlia consotensis]